MFSGIKNVHLIGIGGSGMSGIAEVLINSGFQVSGSDIKASTATASLEKLGAQVSIGHRAQAIEGAQLIVVSSAVDKNNPEVLAAVQNKIPIIHRSEMLAELMRLKASVIVAGTHGKTTTTSFLATVLTQANVDPTIIIGGKLNLISSNARAGKGNLFLAEADESDGSFLRFSPFLAVLTNVDEDHLDHYGTYENIILAFKSFVDKVPFNGALCACIDDVGVKRVIKEYNRTLITFGFDLSAQVTAKNIKFDGFVSHFTPVVFGQELPPVKLPMPGKYNILNALASFAVAKFLSLSLENVSHALSSFSGVEHRFTVLADCNDTVVVDDYAHNPKKVSSVLEGARAGYPHHHVCAIFQPHRYSRMQLQGEEFSKSFSAADTIIVTPIYAASETPISDITQISIAERILLNSKKGNKESVITAASLDEATRIAFEVSQKHSRTILITLGAGDVQRVSHELAEKVKSRK